MLESPDVVSDFPIMLDPSGYRVLVVGGAGEAVAAKCRVLAAFYGA